MNINCLLTKLKGTKIFICNKGLMDNPKTSIQVDLKLQYIAVFELHTALGYFLLNDQ